MSESKRLSMEANRLNFYREYEALKRLVQNNEESFRAGRLLLFNAVEKMIKNPTNYPKSVQEEIKQAGLILWKSGGIQDMSDTLLWSLIPKYFHREIDLYWDGIGEWKS